MEFIIDKNGRLKKVKGMKKALDTTVKYVQKLAKDLENQYKENIKVESEEWKCYF